MKGDTKQNWLKEALASSRKVYQETKRNTEAKHSITKPTSTSSKPSGFLDALKAISGKKCPRCDSNEIKTLRGKSDILGAGLALTFPLLMAFGAGKPSKNLNVCKLCGFSWEDR